jgi:hypothetical protein
MRVAVSCVAMAVLLLAAGCGSSANPPNRAGSAPNKGRTATTRNGPYSEPVAYVLPDRLAARLARGDARAMLDRRGRVIARSMWKGYAGGVLIEWLRRYHVSMYDLPPSLARAMSAVADKQDLTLLILTPRHRRYESVLDRIRPSASELTHFYERFSEERWPRAGAAMLDWLRVLRTSLHAVHAGQVVVVPLSD